MLWLLFVCVDFAFRSANALVACAERARDGEEDAAKGVERQAWINVDIISLIDDYI